MKKKFLPGVLSLILTLGCLLALSACGGTNDPGDTPAGPAGTPSVSDKPASKIEITRQPDKTEYYVGDEFSAAGGILTVTYEDGTTGEVSMTAQGVELTAPDMTKAGNKTITVSYGGQRTRFSVSVQNQGFKLTLDQNYDGGENTVLDVVKGSTVSRPADPTRAGYTFYNWYQDKDCTTLFDFSAPITADTTIYAVWKQDGVTYYEVTYDLNYYGVVPRTYTQLVADGETAKPLAGDFTRTDYTFTGWCADPQGNAPYTSAPVTADTSIYAGWSRTRTGSSVYTFEAEHTDLTGKTGPGFSGSASEGDMIVDNASASGGKAVSYMYKNGLTLSFCIASDTAVSDAVLVLSLAAEMDNITFTDQEFQVLVNDAPQSYSALTLPNDNTFSDALTISGISLKEGANTIVLKVNNTKRPMGDASTYAATAPMIDCIRIETSAVLIWDANQGLPVQY